MELLLDKGIEGHKDGLRVFWTGEIGGWRHPFMMAPREGERYPFSAEYIRATDNAGSKLPVLGRRAPGCSPGPQAVPSKPKSSVPVLWWRYQRIKNTRQASVEGRMLQSTARWISGRGGRAPEARLAVLRSEGVRPEGNWASGPVPGVVGWSTRQQSGRRRTRWAGPEHDP